MISSWEVEFRRARPLDPTADYAADESWTARVLESAGTISE